MSEAKTCEAILSSVSKRPLNELAVGDVALRIRRLRSGGMRYGTAYVTKVSVKLLVLDEYEEYHKATGLPRYKSRLGSVAIVEATPSRLHEFRCQLLADEKEHNAREAAEKETREENLRQAKEACVWLSEHRPDEILKVVSEDVLWQVYGTLKAGGLI